MKNKKPFVALLLVLCLALCSCGTSSNGKFDDYNILTFALVEDSREVDEMADMTIYRETWLVTNPSDDVISDISIKVSFCDENGTIVYTDSRRIGVSLAAGQSIEQPVYTEKEYVTSSVTVYGYSIGNKKSVELDLLAQTCEFYREY